MTEFYYSCSLCGKNYDSSDIRYTCEVCGDKGLLDVIYDYQKLKKGFIEKSEISAPFRYSKILPFRKKPDSKALPLHIGNSQAIPLAGWKKKFGSGDISLFDDSRNPTCSFKDRASAVACLCALEWNEKKIACASTGNAGSSLAGICASMGLSSLVFVPENAPLAKLVQLLMYNSTLIRVRGNYDDAYDLCQKVAAAENIYNRSTGYNPVLLEGKKTAALEIYEKVSLPDRIYVSVGDGCIIAGIYKGFLDLKNMGVISSIPFITGVQSELSDSYVKSVENGYVLTPVKAATMADSISVDIPRAFSQAIRVAKDGNGEFIRVSDDEIAAAREMLAAEHGVFAEPAGAAAAAGYLSQRKNVSRREKIVILNTGNGLKDTASALKRITLPEPVNPDPEKILKLLRGR